MNAHASAAEIRGRLDHPVIDADGHLIEFVPLLRDYVLEIGGSDLAARFDQLVNSSRVTRQLDWMARREHGVARTGWWGLPARNTLDRATATIPRLLYERLDEFGIDVGVLYPTLGLAAMAVDDDELRQALARGATATSPSNTAIFAIDSFPSASFRRIRPTRRSASSSTPPPISA